MKLTTADEFGIDDVVRIVTDIYKIEVTVRHDEAFFKCVVHSDHNPSCSINTKTGYWHCFSCGAGGDILSLGSKALGKTRLQVASTLSPTDPKAVLSQIQRMTNAKRQGENREPKTSVEIPQPEAYQDGPFDFMYRRGFTDQTLHMFGVRYVNRTRIRTKNNKRMGISHCIAIPIYEEDGTLIGWVYRKTSKSPDWQPRYLYTPGVLLTEVVFGLNLIAPYLRSHSEFCVTEGPIDAMWMTQCGYDGVATFGSGNVTNPKKIGKLMSAQSIVICGDRDDAGVEFVHKLGGLTTLQKPTRVFRYQTSWRGTDPNSLTPAQVVSGVTNAIPFTTWEIRNTLQGGGDAEPIRKANRTAT